MVAELWNSINGGMAMRKPCSKLMLMVISKDAEHDVF